MTLAELVKGLPVLAVHGDLTTKIGHIAYDSRQVEPGSLFVCIDGFVTDGHLYIAQAKERGCSSLIVQKQIDEVDLPWVRVANSRRALAQIATVFYDYPSTDLELIGVTGTKGKTTTSYLIQKIFSLAGRQTGLIGTIETILGDQRQPALRTTPESLDLQALLAKMVERRFNACVMEVSSQGLMLDRVYGCDYRTAVFTNFSPDHIGPGEHSSLADYLAAKLQIFALAQQAVINRDMPQYEEVKAAVRGPCLTFGLEEEADVRAINVRNERRGQRTGTAFDLISPWYQEQGLFVGLPGRFNLLNALAAIACAGLSAIPLPAIKAGLADIKIPGRVEVVETSLDFQVIVDYAHNAVSLDELLRALRSYNQGRLIVVFGNGGNRDKSRRFEMGEVAGRLADLTVITSDNPRLEDPDAIIADIISGIEPTGASYLVQSDRALAIEWAIRQARPDDMVIIAGKGHENYQIFHDRTIHFDDVETAGQILRKVEEEQNVSDIL